LIQPNELASVIYFHLEDRQVVLPFGETIMPQVNQPRRRKTKIMGDKSPKANQKKSSQNRAKANSADQMKKQAVAAKQASGAGKKK
jgi:hypothetical protein